MWVDINQKYVELGLFPQWYDIARELNIDQVSKTNRCANISL
jgi:hypothetical protein